MSDTHKAMFVGAKYFDNVDKDEEYKEIFGIKKVEFLLLVMLSEHVVFVIKYIVEYLMSGDDEDMK